MRAAASAALPSDDEVPSVTSQQGRQLHLVFGSEAESAAPPAGGAALPEESVSTSCDVLTSLAEYALGLRAGAPCFCCGRPLTACECAGEDESGGYLECVECGASVAAPVASLE